MLNVLTQFTDLKLSEPTLRAIEELKFIYATEIQSKTIPALLEGKDIIGQAATGTGKTAAFAIPIIEKIDKNSSDVQALILCPTRELGVQVTDQITKFMKHHKGLSVLAIYGGQNISTQLKALKKGVQIVVGTPGRIMDHMRRGTLKLEKIKFLTLDEADQMLDMGFREDIETILKDTPRDRQTVMFSATMSPAILKLTQKYQNKPEHINVISDKEQSVQIKQIYFEINNKSKVEAMKRLLNSYNIYSALIFCNTKHMVDDLCTMLKSKKYNVGALHGDLNQRKRDNVMNGFRKDQIQLLIATDVAARGIDVENIDAVFNFDFPRDSQDYIHRIGRTGRAGKEGKAFSFVVGKEVEQLKRIARAQNLKIEAGTIPSAEESSETSINAALEGHLDANSRKKYLPLIHDLKGKGRDIDELAALLLKKLLEQDSKVFNEEVDFSSEKYSRKHKGDRSSRSFGSRGGGERRRSNSGSSSSSSGSSSGFKKSGSSYKSSDRKPYGKSKSGSGSGSSSSSLGSKSKFKKFKK